MYGIARKGRIAAGYDADLTVGDLKRRETITDRWIASRVRWTPYDGTSVTGWPVGTFVRGRKSCGRANSRNRRLVRWLRSEKLRLRSINVYSRLISQKLVALFWLRNTTCLCKSSEGGVARGGPRTSPTRRQRAMRRGRNLLND